MEDFAAIVVEALAARCVGPRRRVCRASRFFHLLRIRKQFLSLWPDGGIAIELHADLVAHRSRVVWELTALADTGDLGDQLSAACGRGGHHVIRDFSSLRVRQVWTDVIRRPEVGVESNASPPRRR